MNIRLYHALVVVLCLLFPLSCLADVGTAGTEQSAAAQKMLEGSDYMDLPNDTPYRFDAPPPPKSTFEKIFGVFKTIVDIATIPTIPFALMSPSPVAQADGIMHLSHIITDLTGLDADSKMKREREKIIEESSNKEASSPVPPGQSDVGTGESLPAGHAGSSVSDSRPSNTRPVPLPESGQ